MSSISDLRAEITADIFALTNISSSAYSPFVIFVLANTRRVTMNNNKDKSNGPLGRFLNAIGSIVSEVWNAAETCGFCCGIRFDREGRGNEMPTPSSCCGVRV